jgi:SAM-dependent methyltransferase
MAADLYQCALERLENLDRRVALAAYVVETIHPNAAVVANPLFAFAQHRFPDVDLVEAYVTRAGALATLQQRFETDPRPETLGDPDAPIDRDLYNLSLLLSIALTNHRFEIMQRLDEFLRGCRGAGRIASIGTGTGYELHRMAAILPETWSIESYDIDESVQTEARAFLDYFDVHRDVRWGTEFPLDSPPADFRGCYDAIVMCELLEHLPDPGAALTAARACLAPDGSIFATMAINIAQEDHIYLYSDIASCRAQIRQAGLSPISEWITPQTTLPPPADRERTFKKGNYVATLRPSRNTQ